MQCGWIYIYSFLSKCRERGARALEERLAADGLAVGGKEENLSHKDAAENVWKLCCNSRILHRVLTMLLIWYYICKIREHVLELAGSFWLWCAIGPDFHRTLPRFLFFFLYGRGVLDPCPRFVQVLSVHFFSYYSLKSYKVLIKSLLLLCQSLVRCEDLWDFY